MKIPQWRIYDLQTKLKEEIHCPNLPMSFDDPCQWVGDVKDRNIQLIVYIEDTLFRVVERVEYQPENLIIETDDSEKVIQAAKEFKCKYL